jgi:ABC-2 type transport system permease protein
MLVVALTLGVMCAVAQALSALLARSTTSAVLSYLVVFALTIGTLIVFGLASALATETVTRTGLRPAYVQPADPYAKPTAEYPPPTELQEYNYTTTVSRTDQVWWLLAPNPFVVLADAAPALPERYDPVTGSRQPSAFDPLGEIGAAVRLARKGPLDDSRMSDSPLMASMPAVWPYGLAINVLLGAAALVITTRRLRTPAGTLPRGLRVA